MSAGPTLFSHRLEDITLPQTLLRAPNKEAAVLLYSPAACRFARFDGDRLSGPDGTALSALDQVFEARLFCDAWELRWLRDPAGNGEGTAVLLGESPADWSERTELACRSSRPNHYLLWGLQWVADECSDHAELVSGWSMLASARVGCLPVPVDELQALERVCMTSVEYFGPAPGVAGEHGNVVALEERFTGLCVWRSPDVAAKEAGE